MVVAQFCSWTFGHLAHKLAVLLCSSVAVQLCLSHAGKLGVESGKVPAMQNEARRGCGLLEGTKKELRALLSEAALSLWQKCALDIPALLAGFAFRLLCSCWAASALSETERR